MKKFLLIISTIFNFTNLYAQKALIDSTATTSWPSVQRGSITKNGKYVVYTIENQPENKHTVVLQSVSGKWNKKIICSSLPQASLSLNDKYCILNQNDSIQLVELGRNKPISIAGVKSFKTSFGSPQFISFTLKSSPDSLFLLNLNTGNKLAFGRVKDYNFSPSGSALLLQTLDDENTRLDYIDLAVNKRIHVWKGKEITFTSWHSKENQFIFYATPANTETNFKSALFKFNASVDSAILLADNIESMQGYHLSKLLGISMDGNRVFIKYEKHILKQRPDTQPIVNIWNYKDKVLKLDKGSPPESESSEVTYCLNVKNRILFPIQNNMESIEIYFNSYIDTIALVKTPLKTSDRLTDNKFYFVSTIDGTRKEIHADLSSISPGGKFLYGSDHQYTSIIVYSVIDRNYYNLTKAIFSLDSVLAKDRSGKRQLSIAAWLPLDSAVIVTDGFDLWNADPRGIRLPFCVTNGYGFRSNTSLSIVGQQLWDWILRLKHNQVILRATNLLTHESGFFKSNISKTADPTLLCMQSVMYGRFRVNFSKYGQRWSNVSNPKYFLLSKETAAMSPNFYVTSDFVHFKPVSDVYPEKSYNWMTGASINYRTVDGQDGNAAIYKPSDFQSGKKYPVIFYYYEVLAERVNQYHTPELFNGGINIPWLVSRGYIVCTPDIMNSSGNPGRTAYSSVLGLYNVLKDSTWMDPGNIGICGHSFGGLETNYILTSTNVFKAAYSGAGISDLISFHNSIYSNGISRSENTEVGQIGMKVSVWDDKELYRENSAVYNADKVSTPVLLMSNQSDAIVPFTQGVEFFLALRRLGKLAWLLEYPGQDHTLESPKTQIDFTNRLTEYFDHFLKGMPAPLWMVDYNR